MSDEERLCLACGLCCDGTLFDVVRLAPTEAIAHAALTRLGIPLRALALGQGWMAPQPCGALSDRACNVYVDRPGRCRDYRCNLLEAVACDEVDRAEALATVAQAHALRHDAAALEVHLARHFRGRAAVRGRR